MRSFLGTLGISILLLSSVTFAEQSVSTEDQAKIYLNSSKNTGMGLFNKMTDGAWSSACRDARVLVLISNALNVESIKTAASKIRGGPTTMRNLASASKEIRQFVNLCESNLSEDEAPAASSLAESISSQMGLE